MRDERSLTLLGHLNELRRRLTISVVALAITTVIAFLFRDWLLWVLLRPVPNLHPIYLELTEMLGVYMKVSLLGGFILAFPVIVYQAAMFVVPALMPKERRALFIMLPAVIVLFISGIAFGYFVLLPPSLRFLTTFGSNVAQPQIRISNYFTVVTTLLFWLGVVFEIPLVMYILARVRLLSPNVLIRNWRVAFVLAFVLGAIITPTFDPINQSLVAIPLIVLYGLGTMLAKLAWRGQKTAATGTAKVEPAEPSNAPQKPL